ncbi:MAG: glycosyltransferase [Candidatus Kerfeldbacteria bacterium]
MRPLSLLFLNYEYPPLGGGAATANHFLLKEYASHPELTVDLVTSSTGHFKTENLGRFITIHYLDIGKRGSLHYQSNRDLLAYSYKAHRYCSALVRERQYDLVHAFFGIPCGYIAMKLGLPYIVSLRGSDVPFYNDRFRLPDRLLFRRLSRRVWRSAEAVTAVSESLCTLAVKTAPQQKISIIRNGVDGATFQMTQRPILNKNDFNILYVGRLVERKGLRYLLDAFASVAAQHPNSRLHIAGDGPDKEKLQIQVQTLGIEGSVIFHGNVAYDQLPALYRQSDVIVLPSLTEALGNVVLEAMASGVPVITTNTGARELVGDCGIIVETASSSVIASALVRLIENPDLRTELSKKGLAAARSLSWKAVADQYLALYSSVRSDSSSLI